MFTGTSHALPYPIVIAATVIMLMAAAWLAELLVPMQAISEQRWVYVLRPQAKLRSVDVITLANFGGAIAIGILVGLIHNNLPLWILLAVFLRVMPLFRWQRRLPGLLVAGERRTVGTGALYVHDSELVSEAMALGLGRYRPQPSTANLYRLFFRRLVRRHYVLIAAVLVLSVAIVLGSVNSSAAVGLFLLGWAFVSTAVLRCTNFQPILESGSLRLIVMIVCALIAGLVVFMLMGKPWTIPMVVTSIGYSAWRRSKPRSNENFVVVDVGFGAGIPLGTVEYVTAGLGPTAMIALALVFGA